ncbi:MAG: stage III sporulation protein AG [Oscillospiraceae bacterium]
MEKVTEYLKNIFSKEGKKKNNLLFILGITGILLIFLSGYLPKQSKTATAKGNASQTEDNFINATEKRLSEMLAKTEGVGNVEVMITLESAEYNVYAQDERTDTQTQAGSDETNEKSFYQSEHILVDDGNGKKPLVETRRTPEIKGVAVVCDGGADIIVVKRVTDLVSALLDLSTNRICVTKMI